MGVRLGIARAVGAASTAVLRGAFRRPAENFPGKAALVIDPQLIAELRGRMRRGSVCVVGTYLHGPLLAKNPEVADELLQRALNRRARKSGDVANPLRKLDDSVEKAANGFMISRLGVR